MRKLDPGRGLALRDLFQGVHQLLNLLRPRGTEAPRLLLALMSVQP
jgi:hypothetical protein